MKIGKLVKIKGIGKIVAKTFVEHIRDFIEFLHECGLESKLDMIQHPLIVDAATSVNAVTSVDAVTSVTASTNATISPLFGKKICMTKVRDQEIIQKLSQIGAILSDTVNSDTFILIVKSKEDTSVKIKKALEKGIPIMTPDEFKLQYM